MEHLQAKDRVLVTEREKMLVYKYVQRIRAILYYYIQTSTTHTGTTSNRLPLLTGYCLSLVPLVPIVPHYC